MEREITLENKDLSSEIINVDFNNENVLKAEFEDGYFIRESIVPCELKIKGRFKLIAESVK